VALPVRRVGQVRQQPVPQAVVAVAVAARS